MAARRGAGLETRLIAQCDQARRDKLAVVFRCHPPTVGTPGSMSYSGTGPPDFIGFMWGVPKGVAFDAKEVAKGNVLPFSRIEPHQGTDLEATHASGGYAFLAVQFGARGTYAFRWVDIRGRYWQWRLYGDSPSSVSIDDGIKFDHWLEVCR